jgi:hypothetical protein
MSNPAQSLETLHDIKRMMERSSRFISLSGWSGIAAGACALVGAGLAHQRIVHYYQTEYQIVAGAIQKLKQDLILIAVLTFIAAFILAIFFTWLKTKKKVWRSGEPPPETGGILFSAGCRWIFNLALNRK